MSSYEAFEISQEQAARLQCIAAPYAPTPLDVVREALKLAQVTPNDCVFDLGSGDGRVIRAAAHLGARGYGVELDLARAEQSHELAIREGISGRVDFEHGDLHTVDLSPATLVYLYLMPKSVNALRYKLQCELRPGARVLSHDYRILGWQASRIARLRTKDKARITGKHECLLYLYEVPGAWK